MTAPQERLREWTISKLDERSVYGLEWHDKSQMTFKVIWLHQRSSEWRDEFGQVFMEWAQHTGKYRPGIDGKNYTQWKTTLRNAMHKCEEFKELFKSLPKVKPYPYKIYQILQRKKKKPIARTSAGSERETFVPVSDSSCPLPLVLHEMSSPESSLRSPSPQQVPGTPEVLEVPDTSNLTVTTTSDNQSGSCETSRGSSIGHIEPAQELNLTSSEFREILDEVQGVDASSPVIPLSASPSVSAPVVATDLLLQAMSNSILPPHQQVQNPTFSPSSNDQDLANYLTSNTQAITDPQYGEQPVDSDWLNNEIPINMDNNAVQTFDPINSVCGVSEPPLAQGNPPSQMLNSWRDPLLQHNPSIPLVRSSQEMTHVPETNEVVDNIGQSTYVAEAFSDLFPETRDGNLTGTADVAMEESLEIPVQQNPATSRTTQDGGGGFTVSTTGSSVPNHQAGHVSKPLEKYNYTTRVLPEHTCQVPCNLFLELFYLGHLVRKYSISNPSGCRVHSQVNPLTAKLGQANEVDIEAVYGLGNRDPCELPPWPEEIKLKSPNKFQTLLQGLRRGVMIESRKGSIYVTRLCKMELFYSSGDSDQLVEISRTKANNIHQDIKVFDYETAFRPALENYKTGGGPKPNAGVYVYIGQKSTDMTKLLLVLRVTSCQALRDLHQTEKEEEDKSLSLKIAQLDSYDKIDSVLQDIADKLTIEDK